MAEPVPPAARLATRSLYLCTSDRADLPEFVSACIDGGVDIVQLRDKDLDARALVACGTRLAELCRARSVLFLVNDRPDIALACGADGVHVGQDDIDPEWARTILGPEAIVGLSTHSPGELDSAMATCADYVSVGPVVATPTKPGRAGTGLSLVEHAQRRADRPFFVTGGVTPDNVAEIAAAGGRRFVVVRYLTEAGDPRAAATRLRSAVDTALAAVN